MDFASNLWTIILLPLAARLLVAAGNRSEVFCRGSR